MAGGDGGDAEGDREQDVGQRLAGATVAQKVEGLEAEGGEGGKAAAQADHDEEAGVVIEGIAAAGGGECGEKADDARADDVDEDGSPGERALGQPCNG